MFTSDDYNTKFLPNIEFKNLWKEDISDKTRDVIWKYLQLILFSVSKGLEDGESFGDTAKLFEAIDEGDLKNKLEETMNEMNSSFTIHFISTTRSSGCSILCGISVRRYSSLC